MGVAVTVDAGPGSPVFHARTSKMWSVSLVRPVTITLRAVLVPLTIVQPP